MPENFSAFWLEDMTHAEETSFTVMPENTDDIAYLFFPGCRLGASDPAYVKDAYKLLQQTHPDTALLADCCGAPAFWAGDMRLFAEKSASLRKKWEALGSPVPVCACPSCAVMLKTVLPGCKPVSLYTLVQAPAHADIAGAGFSVYDPCASRFDSQAQDSVRKLMTGAGLILQPLPFERENTLCCGWGGQHMIANPGISGETAVRCASLADTTYVTYCINCRDSLTEAGKPALHILDILLGLNDPARKPPTHTQRRENRESLFLAMTGSVPDGGRPGAADGATGGQRKPALYLDDSLRRKISGYWLLESDLLEAVLYCEERNRKIKDEGTGTFAGYHRKGRLTCWVEYKPEKEGYRLLNAYAHKVTIEERG